jgi:hypothetical protein
LVAVVEVRMFHQIMVFPAGQAAAVVHQEQVQRELQVKDSQAEMVLPAQARHTAAEVVAVQVLLALMAYMALLVVPVVQAPIVLLQVHLQLTPAAVAVVEEVI